MWIPRAGCRVIVGEGASTAAPDGGDGLAVAAGVVPAAGFGGAVGPGGGGVTTLAAEPPSEASGESDTAAASGAGRMSIICPTVLASMG